MNHLAFEKPHDKHRSVETSTSESSHSCGFFALITFMFACTLHAGCTSIDYRQVESPEIRTIGVPVKSVNWVRLHESRGVDGDPAILATMGQNADNLFVLDIDPRTGAFRQFLAEVEKANYPTATLVSSSGFLYIGAAYAGHLLRYDPLREELVDLGAINPGKATFPCAITEDDEGVLWIGSYGACDLTSFDPRTGAFTHIGRMDDTDMYNYPMVNADGAICCRIMMTQPHLVVYDPESGRKKAVGPITVKNRDTFSLIRGEDGWVYIQSSLGNFRIEGFEAIPVSNVPPSAKKESPSGLSFSFTDAGRQLYRTLSVTNADDVNKRYKLDYSAAGNDIFCLHRGPDDRLYGSSILPLHLFRHDPLSGETVDLGKCSASSGEAYSMATLDSVIYISSYPAARMSAYNPFKGYRYGSDTEANPRELGRVDDVSYRPRSTLTGPLGRVWLASLPDYGIWGGPLSWYDPVSEERGKHPIAGEGSCYTLAHLDKQDLIAVGTSISGGSGTKPKIDRASLILWDYKRETVAWEGYPDQPVDVFNALCTGPDGLLYGTVSGGGTSSLFIFDPDSHEFMDMLELPKGHPLDLGLMTGPDSALYGFTDSCFYRLDPKRKTMKVIVSDDNGFHTAGPFIGANVYFAQDHLLKTIRIFE